MDEKGQRKGSRILQLFEEAVNRAEHAPGTCDCCGEAKPMVKIQFGDKEIEGTFVLAIALSDAGELGVKVQNGIEGHHVTPIELIAMLSALDDMKERVAEHLLSASQDGMLAGIDPSQLN